MQGGAGRVGKQAKRRLGAGLKRRLQKESIWLANTQGCSASLCGRLQVVNITMRGAE